MPRATSSPATKRRHKRILKQAKGYWGRRHSNFRIARETVERGLAFAYRDRRQRKRQFRRLWITRINAACRLNDITYSAFINALNVKGIELNRKVLADLALQDPQAFTDLVKSIKN